VGVKISEVGVNNLIKVKTISVNNRVGVGC